MHQHFSAVVADRSYMQRARICLEFSVSLVLSPLIEMMMRHPSAMVRLWIDLPKSNSVLRLLLTRTVIRV